MENEDGIEKDKPLEEREEAEDGLEEEEEEKEEEEDEDGDGVEEGEGDDEIEEDGEEECSVRFEGEMNPLDLVKDVSSEIQLYQQFERLEHEALAEKKRMVIAAIQGQGYLTFCFCKCCN